MTTTTWKTSRTLTLNWMTFCVVWYLMRCDVVCHLRTSCGEFDDVVTCCVIWWKLMTFSENWGQHFWIYADIWWHLGTFWDIWCHFMILNEIWGYSLTSVSFDRNWLYLVRFNAMECNLVACGDIWLIIYDMLGHWMIFGVTWWALVRCDVVSWDWWSCNNNVWILVIFCVIYCYLV